MPRLKPMQPAPAFQTQLLGGDPFDLASLRGKKVWIAFYRYARCPLCNLHLNFVIAKSSALAEKGLTVVAVFESEASRFPKFLGGHPNTPFPVVADAQKKLYRLFGLERSWSSLFHPGALWSLLSAQLKGFRQPLQPDGDLQQLPAHFLVDEQGRIQRAHYGAHAADHIPWDEVERFVFRPIS